MVGELGIGDINARFDDADAKRLDSYEMEYANTDRIRECMVNPGYTPEGRIIR